MDSNIILLIARSIIFSISQIISAWVVSQSFKAALKIIVNGRKNFKVKMFFDDGDFPSSHTAVKLTATFSVVYRILVFLYMYLIGSPISVYVVDMSTALVAYCITSSFIVMRDAGGVRRDVGKNGELLRDLARCIANTQILQETYEEIARNVKIKNGHLPHQIIGGIVIAAIVELWYIFFFTSNFIWVIIVTFIYFSVSFAIFWRKKGK